MLDLVEAARERLPRIRNGLPALLGPEQALVGKFSWQHLFFYYWCTSQLFQVNSSVQRIIYMS